MKELVLGAGNQPRKILRKVSQSEAFENPTRVDIDPDCKPDLLWDLNELPLPFEDEAFDEIHAYSILEHLGRQGDWRGFFREWTEWHRLLKPGGLMMIVTPRHGGAWVWGDPGHTRYIGAETLTFLNQEYYAQEVGVTSMTDYRHVWSGHFVLVHTQVDEQDVGYILQKRPWP